MSLKALAFNCTPQAIHGAVIQRFITQILEVMKHYKIANGLSITTSSPA
jgi:hypothetical protein